MMWVLRLVAVDFVILTLWMFLDDPHKAMTREVYGYAGKPAAHFLAARCMILEMISRRR